MRHEASKLLSQISAKAREIHTDSYTMSVGEIISLYKDGELDIHPEFQRFFRWSPTQKTKFVESIILGIPIPSIFVSQRDDGVWDVIDGVQRLSTIFQFVGILKDEHERAVAALVLESTDYLPALEGMRWHNGDRPDGSFPNSLRLDFKRHKLDVKIVRKESDPDTKYDLFERLNTLGSRLSDQEVRNCLLVMINPAMHQWLENISRFRDFVATTALSERALEERYDMELVLRFLAFTRASDDELKGVKEFDEYITASMRRMASNPDFDRDGERMIFEKTFSAIRELDKDAFTRQETSRGRGGFLISMFETVAMGLGYRIRTSPGKAVDAGRLRKCFVRVWNDPVFKRYSGSGQSASSRIPHLVPFGRTVFADV